MVTKDALTESTLLDYVRFQSSQERELTGATINQRVAIVDRALRIAFPGAPGQIAPALQSTYWQRAPMGIGRPRPALSRLRVKTAKRTIVPLSVDEVARFWSSFRNSRDLAIVGLMLLQGLRSQEVLDLRRDDLLLSESQIRVRGKGSNHLALRYEISVQSWSSWLWDWTKGQVIEFVIASMLAYILYGVIRRSRRRWWLYFGLASFPILAVFLLVSPVLLDPLFDHFEPLENTQPALVAEIEKVVKHGGLDLPRDRMFEMKASEKVNAVDAYVTGIGASKRLVVWDTTIAKMTAPETVFVVGHEMGHYMLNHIPKSIALSGTLIIVVLMLVHLAVKRTLDRRQRRWSLRGLEDWASLPVLLLFTYLFFFLAEPAFNTFSRYQEHQADVYGLEVIHGIVPDSSGVAAASFQILGEVDLADPNPSAFIKFWLYSHPALGDRITFAQEYDPWSRGELSMFVR